MEPLSQTPTWVHARRYSAPLRQHHRQYPTLRQTSRAAAM